MKVIDLNHNTFSEHALKPYEKRAPDFSGRFIRWFLENIFRLEEIDADDACVDAKHDKGVDAIYVDDVSETAYIIQAKTKTKDNAEFGDAEIKEFYGTLQQFDSKNKIEEVYAETKNDKLKQTIARTSLASKVDSGYDVFGVFISNARANKDAKAILAKIRGGSNSNNQNAIKARDLKSNHNSTDFLSPSSKTLLAPGETRALLFALHTSLPLQTHDAAEGRTASLYTALLRDRLADAGQNNIRARVPHSFIGPARGC